MALKGSSIIASTRSAVSVPTDMIMLESAAPTSGTATMGFFVSLCMVDQCLIYGNHDDITIAYINVGYEITKISANAFVGATYLSVN